MLTSVTIVPPIKA